MGSFCNHFGVISDHVWVIFGHFGIILGPFCGHFGVILGQFWGDFSALLGTFGDQFKFNLRSFLILFDSFQPFSAKMVIFGGSFWRVGSNICFETLNHVLKTTIKLSIGEGIMSNGHQ